MTQTYVRAATTRTRAVAPVLALLLFVGGCSSDIPLTDAPTLYTAAGAADPFASVPPAWRTNQVHVLYATDRATEPTDNGKRAFGFVRSMALEFGAATVSMGENLAWDDLVNASRSNHRKSSIAMKVTDVSRIGSYPNSNQPPVYADGHFAEIPALIKGNTEATALLHAQLKEMIAPAARKEVFVYVHGYNNSFDEAAIRMAMLWHYMGREGVPVVYSWPAGSGGVLRGYNRDRESGEFTVFHLKQFLKAVADCPEVGKIHIIAHSRGTDVTMTALRELNLEFKTAPAGARARMKLGNVVLAAPDLDWEVFNQRVIAERLGSFPESVTVYVSQDDQAIGLADWLFQSGQRLGTLMGKDVHANWQESLKRMPGAAVVDVHAKTLGLGHAYFVDCPAVLSDLILLLRDNRQPGAANGRPLVQRDDGLWQLDEGYPNAAAGE